MFSFNIQYNPTQSILRLCAVGIILGLLTACEYSYTQFSEPAVKGKIIDFETRQPIVGALVYGYYALGKGSIGGGTLETEVLRSFEVASDQQGEFEIPAWTSKKTIWDGKPKSNFPLIGVYKAGYAYQQDSINTLRRWVPTVHNEGESIRTEELIDWRGRPIPLKPVKSEYERYRAIASSGNALYMIGDSPCRWEAHVRLLKMRHYEIKDMMQRMLPKENIDKNGLAKGRYYLPTEIDDDLFIKPTFVDRLKKAYDESRDKWSCQNPHLILKRDST